MSKNTRHPTENRVFWGSKIIGISKTISISKTKKMTASRKNRREKGIRAVSKGSNPHSKGDIFSRSLVEWRDRVRVTVRRARGKIIARRVVIVEGIIS